MYAKNYDIPTLLYSLPVWFGDRSNTDYWVLNKDAIVDTGCTRTTLDKSVLDWIIQINPSYPLRQRQRHLKRLNPRQRRRHLKRLSLR